MKRFTILLLTIVFLFNSSGFCFAQPNIEMYKAEERNAGLPVLISIFPGMGLGHAVAGDFERGAQFFATEILGILVVAYGSSLSNSGDSNQEILGGFLVGTAGLGLLITRLNEIGDAAGTVHDHNEMLKKKYDVDITIKDGYPALQLSYTF